MKPEVISILKCFGIRDKGTYFEQAFARNIGLLTEAEQRKLSRARVAIPGMGGVGGVHLITLARTGFGSFNIADFDVYEPANINRQYGATVQAFGQSKITIMKEQALSVNPYLDIRLFEEGISASNIDNFLDGVDVVLDGLDFFQFEIRRMLFKRAAEKGIYVITAGPMGYSSAMLIFSPDGMGFDEYFNISETMTDKDKFLSFALGLSPKATHIKYMNLKKVDLKSKAGPSLNVACQICSGMAVTEAIKVILNKDKIKSVPHYIQYDPYLQTLKRGYLFLGNKNPLQRLKIKVVERIINKKKAVIKPDIPEKPDMILSPGKKIPDSVMKYLVRAGLQAPSGDNCQPWEFDIKRNRIDLYLDREKDRSFFNFNQAASLISCGAVLENIKIAASSFGINATIVLNEFFHKNDMVATINLAPAKSKKDLLSHFIWKRHTNRKGYKKNIFDFSILQSVESCIAHIPGARISFVTDKDELRRLAYIIYKIDRIRTEFKPLHEHLMSMIRFSERESLETRDGFPLKNLEAGFAGETFLKVTKPWSIMNFINTIGLGRLVALNSYQGMINAAGAALITLDGTSEHGFVLGGRALERVWLTLTSHKVQMQPMAAPTLFYLRLMNEKGKSEFHKHHRQVLRLLQDEYQSLFKFSNCTVPGTQIMLFRFGFGDKCFHRTLRKPVDKMIKH